MTTRWAGSVKFRRPSAAHRLEVIGGLINNPISLFVTGPIVRHWGFHCPRAGWRHWKDFTASDSSARIGRGCGEMDDEPILGGFRSPFAKLDSRA